MKCIPEIKLSNYFILDVFVAVNIMVFMCLNVATISLAYVMYDISVFLPSCVLCLVIFECSLENKTLFGLVWNLLTLIISSQSYSLVMMLFCLILLDVVCLIRKVIWKMIPHNLVIVSSFRNIKIISAM
ncbi:unnamed protein product [Musa textilis]